VVAQAVQEPLGLVVRLVQLLHRLVGTTLDLFRLRWVKLEQVVGHKLGRLGQTSPPSVLVMLYNLLADAVEVGLPVPTLMVGQLLLVVG